MAVSIFNVAFVVCALIVTLGHCNDHDDKKHHHHKKIHHSAPVQDMQQGKLRVQGPLPLDFAERFKQAASKAVSCDPKEVSFVKSNPLGEEGVDEVVFEAPADIVIQIEDQAANPASKLTASPLHDFLVERRVDVAKAKVTDAAEPSPSQAAPDIDVDTEMPYGELEAFGREDTAQELTEGSIKESDEMVDQLERAEVAEEKRAVFRALTRLRGAAITSFDGVARSQTGNIDEYNKVHKWRKTHPLRHLADEESDISAWAFPDNADF